MIRVLVVDDSAFSRKVITKILESIPDVEVVERASDGQDALKKTVRLKPDLITLDLEMPQMDGFTFLRWVTNSMPTPVIVVSAKEGNENVFKALDLGAVDFVLKPTPHPSMQLEDIKADLIEKVLAIPLLKMRKVRERMQNQAAETARLLEKGAPSETPQVIAIASSTGGPAAIQTILKELPKGFDVPILIAQHMPPVFTALFAERLNKHTTLRVKEAAEEDSIEPGRVYIAPGGKHLTVEKRGGKMIARVKERSTDSRYSPSANLLFQSIAEEDTPAIAAVLTGMGDDGRDGLKPLKKKRAITIAESDKTAVIFGMPQEAIKAGLIDYVLPLYEIPNAFSTLCRKS